MANPAAGTMILMGIMIVLGGMWVAFSDNFIIGAVVIGVGMFIGLVGIVVINNEIFKEEWEKHNDR